MAFSAIMKTNSYLVMLMGICYSATPIKNEPIAYIGDSQIVGQRVIRSDLEANQYLGIPYAEPPVGNLRFMKTEPIRRLPKVLSAVHQPPACHQYSKYPFPWYINSTEKSEDCLFLNIWTPTDASPQNTKAVMYWIHGGGFRLGSIRDDVYTGTPFTALGDIVVVTVNYRLGSFGFLTSNTDDAPGNAGLWDLLEGLRWVNQNIRAFGGDPARITIAGESAGSVSVGLLSVSPLSRGLFHRQLMQSGSPVFYGFIDNAQNIELSQYLGTLVGCASDAYTIYDHPSVVIGCLKGMDAVKLSKLDMLLFTESTIAFSPQYGDKILPVSVYMAVSNGELLGTELLIGDAGDDGSILSTNYADSFGFFGVKDPPINKKAGQDMMRKIFSSLPQPEVVVNHYLNDTMKENARKEIRQQLFTSFGDVIFLCPTVFYAEKYAEKGSVYFYLWTHRSSTTPWAPWIGAPHYSDVEFVFGRPILNPRRYQPEEVHISSQLIEMWSSFVKFGKPSIPWPLYSKNFPIFKYIGPGTETRNHGMGPHGPNCDVLRPYYGF